MSDTIKPERRLVPISAIEEVVEGKTIFLDVYHTAVGDVLYKAGRVLTEPQIADLIDEIKEGGLCYRV